MKKNAPIFIILALSLIYLAAGRSTLSSQTVLRVKDKQGGSYLIMKQTEDPEELLEPEESEQPETITYLEATTPFAGGLGGNLFDDGFSANSEDAAPCQINYRADDWVIHGIQLVWDNGDNSCSITNTYHGGDYGGNASSLIFSKNKRVARASVWLNNATFVKAIKFYDEDDEEVGTIGETKGMFSFSFNFKGPLVGLKGRAAAYLDSISFITSVPSSSSDPESVLWASEQNGGDVPEDVRFIHQIPKSSDGAKAIWFNLNETSDEIVGVNLDKLKWYGNAEDQKKCSLSLVNATEITTAFNNYNIVGASVSYANGNHSSCGQVGDNNPKASTAIDENSSITGIYGTVTANTNVNSIGWIFRRYG